MREIDPSTDGDPILPEPADPEPDGSNAFTRRRFLGGLAMTVAGGALLDACSAPTATPGSYQGTPSVVPEPTGATGASSFLTTDETRTLGALAERLIPGVDGVPGATASGVVRYIDRRLASDEGIPTYLSPPFARSYTGATPPGPDTDEVIWVQAGQLHRYGIQDVELDSGDQYRLGLAAVDTWARRRYGRPLAELNEKDQDSVLDDLVTGKIDTFQGRLTPTTFFDTVYNDAFQGWLADPAYGGNEDLKVWLALRYPGAQRNYTPEEMHKGTPKLAQSLADLPAMHPGQPRPHVLLPITGTEAGQVDTGNGQEFGCQVPIQP